MLPSLIALLPSEVNDSRLKLCGVYAIWNAANGKKYIGSSKDVVKRFKQHLHDLNNNVHVNPHLQSSWLLDGDKSFLLMVLEEVEESSLLDCEQYWIDNFKSTDRDTGYNISLFAGAPMRGRKSSDETKRKVSIASTGRTHSYESKMKISVANTGHKVSQEQIDRLIEYNRTRVVTDEYRQKMREVKLGIKFTEEHKRKIGLSNKGKRMSEEAIEKIRQAKLKWWADKKSK